RSTSPKSTPLRCSTPMRTPMATPSTRCRKTSCSAVSRALLRRSAATIDRSGTRLIVLRRPDFSGAFLFAAAGARHPMMRQYELVEKVQAYNPAADENLLNKAYVYAMQKHGEQKRASGDPYFNHPLE